jgi:ABC-2 type transport system permease protein
MRTVLTILAKDLRQRSRDSSLLVYAVVLPLGLAFLFSMIMGGGGEAFSARFAVADQDRGPAAAAFTADALHPMRESGLITLREVASEQEGRRLAGQGEVDALFVIPAGFSAAVRAGAATTLQVIGDVDAPVAVQVAREVGEAYATELRSVRLAVSVAGDGRPGPGLEQRAAALPAPLALVADTSAATRELDAKTYQAAGMAVFFLFFAVMFSATGILQERASGTLARLLAAPVSRRAILLGKLLAGVVVGVAGMAVLVVASTLLMGARWGDPLGVTALVVAGVLAATGLMGLVAAFARTAEQASNWQSGVAMILGLFGGAFFPLAQLGWLGAAAVVTPHNWFMRGLADLAAGGSAEVVLLPVVVLLCFAAVSGALALTRAGRMMRI